MSAPPGGRDLAVALQGGDAAPLWRWVGQPTSAAPSTARDELAAATHLVVVAAGDRAGATRGWIALGPQAAVCADAAGVEVVGPTVAALWLADRVDLGDAEQQPSELAPVTVDVDAFESTTSGTGLPDPWRASLAAMYGWWTVEGGRLGRAPVRVDTFVTACGLVAVERTGSVARLAMATPWARLTAALVPLCRDG